MSKIGVDTYSYHRRLGEVRPGEQSPETPVWPWWAPVDAATHSGADVVAVETCFVGRPDRAALERLTASTAGPELMLSWGHPYGVEYGRSDAAEQSLLVWLEVAREGGHSIMRIVVAHPHLRSEHESWEQVRSTAPALTRVVVQAERAGVTLALENHADLTAGQVLFLLDEVPSSFLRVCFDTANAERVGDDLMQAAGALAGLVDIVHVKDIDAGSWHPLSGPAAVPLGSGRIAVQDAVELLEASRPDCWFLVELGHLGPGDVEEQKLIVQDLAWLRRILRREEQP